MEQGYMGYDFTVEEFGRFKDEVLEPEADIELRLYHMSNWVEAARESWHYDADAHLRDLVDQLKLELSKYDEQVEGLTTAELELSMLMDRINGLKGRHMASMRKRYTEAYRAGQRDEGFLKAYRQIMGWDEAAGTFDPALYDGLNPEDLG